MEDIDYISILKEHGDEIGETPVYNFNKMEDNHWHCTLTFMGKSSHARRRNKQQAKHKAAQIFYKYKLEKKDDLTSSRSGDFPPPLGAGADDFMKAKSRDLSKKSYIIRIDSTLSQQQLLEFFGLNKDILDVNFVFQGKEK